MDRKYLNQIKTRLKSFVEKVTENNHALDFMCLVPTTWGNRFVIQVDGEWVRDRDSNALTTLNDYLFDTTTPDLREKIHNISSYKKNGKWQCPSDDFVLIGEMPLILHPAYHSFEI